MSRKIKARRSARIAETDCGNIMLAMVFVMVTAMMLGLVLAGLAQQVSKTKNDRAFTSALPAADAGIQQALAYLNTGQSLPTQVSPSTLTTTQATGTVSYTWYATPNVVTGKPVSYTITSKSTVNNVTRSVSAQLYQSQRFTYALFADRDIVFRGSNVATSYPSAGVGRIGTNGTISINGNGSSSADYCTLYNSTAAGGSGRSSGPCAHVDYQPAKQDIVSAAATQFITDGLNSCPGGPVAYTPQVLQAGRTYCFTSVNFDGTEVVQGTSANPTRIFVSGSVAISNHASVHATGATPDSAGLQIYSLGSSFTMGNHSTIGAAVWAPNATCSGGAQAAVYGSIVCGAIGNVGGWTFDFDTNLSTVGDGQWQMRHYAEN